MERIVLQGPAGDRVEIEVEGDNIGKAYTEALSPYMSRGYRQIVDDVIADEAVAVQRTVAQEE